MPDTNIPGREDMSEDGYERRSCVRFKIPGATVDYQRKTILPKPGFIEEFCPLLDISRGGIRFLAQKPLKPETEVSVKISIPGERIPFTMKGLVMWSASAVAKTYNYQIGVKFHPYGDKKEENLPQNMVKIMALEQKYADKTNEGGADNTSGSNKDEFEI
jgi:hypothetical protein